MLGYHIYAEPVTNRRRFVDIDRSEGWPDGIAVDVQRHVGVPLYAGGFVLRYDPLGNWAGTINLRAAVTSCGFGGDNLEDLYITTARHLPAGHSSTPEKQAGALMSPRHSRSRYSPFCRLTASTRFECVPSRSLQRRVTPVVAPQSHPPRAATRR